LNNLSTATQKFIDTRTSQSITKNKSVHLTSEQTEVLNQLYLEASCLSKVAKAVFADNPEKLKLFDLNGFIRSFSGTRGKKGNVTDGAVSEAA